MKWKMDGLSVGTITQAVLNRIADYLFEVKTGANTVRWSEVNDLDVKSTHKVRGVRYQPTRIRPFKKLMSGQKFPGESVFVDLGCGKGRVLLMAVECGFKRVVGVEFAHELCEIAKRNVSIYRKK